MRTTIAETISAIDRDHSRGSRTGSRPPIWTDRCRCAHLAATHSHGNGWNLQGACLRCDCEALQVVSP